MKMLRYFGLVLAFWSLQLTVALGQGDVISFQGVITVGEEPLNDPDTNLVFRIYEQAEGGDPLWVEEHLGIPVQNGVFSVLLGGSEPIGDLPFGIPLWIGVAIPPDPEILPRSRLAAVPSSMTAASLRLPFWGSAEVPVEEHAFYVENVGGGNAVTVRSTGEHGLVVNEAGASGLFVNWAGDAGVLVGHSDIGVYLDSTFISGLQLLYSVGDGIRLEETGGSGLYIGDASLSGVHVATVGNPSTFFTSTIGLKDGFGVDNTEGSGVFVGRADDRGVAVLETGSHGLYVGNAGAGGLHIDQATNNGIYINWAGFSGVHVGYAANHGFYVTNAGQHGLFVQNAGGDGVHVDNATGWSGYFAGDVKSDGDMWADHYQNNSDLRLKQDIAPIRYGLPEILRLRPVGFKWKQRPEDGTEIGLIAQDVEAIIPEAVSVPDSKNPYYGIGYANLVPVLIRAIQEQQDEINELRTRLEKLEHPLP